mgnify:CR=1 FL=1
MSVVVGVGRGAKEGVLIKNAEVLDVGFGAISRNTLCSLVGRGSLESSVGAGEGSGAASLSAIASTIICNLVFRPGRRLQDFSRN